MEREKLEEKIIQFVFKTRHTFREKLYHKKSFNPFSLLRFNILQFIKKNKRITMKEISQWLEVTPPSATSLINGLVKLDLVKRESSKEDRRIVYLTITAKGKDMLEKIQIKHKNKIREIISKLPQRDQKDLLRILNNFSKIFSNKKL